MDSFQDIIIWCFISQLASSFVSDQSYWCKCTEKGVWFKIKKVEAFEWERQKLSHSLFEQQIWGDILEKNTVPSTKRMSID